MGSPKRLRKKFDTPSAVWYSSRIIQEHNTKAKYGLKKMREVWIAETELRRIRKNVRGILAGRQSEETGRQIVQRLASYGVVSSTATLDELLSIGVDSLLARRLQSVIVNKGMAKSLKQARQLIVHGYIAINGRKVTVPGYLVKTSEENAIGYYKPIDINAGSNSAAGAQQAASSAGETAAAETEQEKEAGADEESEKDEEASGAEAEAS
ncbi:MAG: 30S ribosomal protein S4 [Candidatus Micrarchaeia archaeon]